MTAEYKAIQTRNPRSKSLYLVSFFQTTSRIPTRDKNYSIPEKKKAFHWLVSAICFKPCLFTLDFAYSREVTEKLAKKSIDVMVSKVTKQKVN